MLQKHLFAFLFLSSLSFVLSQFSQPPPRPNDCRGNSSGKASDQQLAIKYFKPYGNWQRPRRNSSDSVVVNITFVLSSINDVLERERIIKISGYLSIRWMDEYRVWMNDFPYNCIDYVVLPATKIWLPDLALMNAEGRYILMNKDGEKARIYSNGYTVFSPGGTFSVYCEYDLTMFPFDTQTCAIKIESWRYTHQYMEFEFASNVTLKYFIENEQWDLISTSQAKVALSYLEPWNNFDHIEFYITIRRKIMYYMMNVIIPSVLIAIAHMATFTLPVGDIEKINISFTCLLAYSVFQLMVVGDMPRSSDHIPLLSIYIDLQMGYIAFSMLGEGISFVALDKIDQTGINGLTAPVVPKFTYAMASFFGRVLCLRHEPPHAKSLQSHVEVYYTTSSEYLYVNETGTEPDNQSDSYSPPAVPYRPTRNKKMRRALKKSKAAETNRHGHTSKLDSVTLDVRQLQWQYVAHVIERVVMVLYGLCISVTPIFMFFVYPRFVAKR